MAMTMTTKSGHVEDHEHAAGRLRPRDALGIGGRLLRAAPRRHRVPAQHDDIDADQDQEPGEIADEGGQDRDRGEGDHRSDRDEGQHPALAPDRLGAAAEDTAR